MYTYRDQSLCECSFSVLIILDLGYEIKNAQTEWEKNKLDAEPIFSVLDEMVNLASCVLYIGLQT